MKKHTTFKIGGPADVLVTPVSEEQIIACIALLRENNVPFYVVGNGSNLLVSDKGIRGVVIKLFRNFADIALEDTRIKAKAGAPLFGLVGLAAKNGLSGLEFASGIPGTIGGAVLMNAGAYGSEMKDVVVETKYLDTEGRVNTCREHEFSYRDSIFQRNGGIILETHIALSKRPSDEIYAEMNRLSALRREKQPLNYPSAGSVFKRPPSYYAGKLISDAGLKGFSVGGAMVSEKHAGFVINTGTATCAEVCALLDTVRDRVFEKFGVMLQREVKFIGET